MATTHYSELKVYALSTPGVENAACEFSLETLSPTYRLLIGVPGKSNAFAISKKLGLPDFLIKKAEENLSADTKDFENLLVDLEEKRVHLEKEKDILKRDRDEAEKIRRELEGKNADLDEKRAALLQDANQEAARILKNAKDTADETIREFNRLKANNPDIAEMEKRRGELGKKLSSAQAATASGGKGAGGSSSPQSSTRAEDLHVGDRIKVLSMNMTGTVHSLPDKKGELEVQMGIMRSKVKLTDVLRIADHDESTFNGQRIAGAKNDGLKKRTPGAFGRTGKSGTAGTGSFSKAASISAEIKLLGMTVDEALMTLDKYLDDAYLSHLPSVRVVHGKGTGALRNAVHQHLKHLPYVESYRLGAFGEGDAGVTIVNFKE